MYDHMDTKEMMMLACKTARTAHAGQVDKGGRPYIEHIDAVAAGVDDPVAKTVAYLHDVLEDSDITAGDLKALGFTDEVIEAVETLTRTEGESYDRFIDRVSGNPLAAQVKLSDLIHNSDLSRIPRPSENDIKRVEKYKKSIVRLKKTMVENGAR